MQIIGQKEFVAIASDPGKEILVIYVAYLTAKMLIYLA